MELGVLLGQFEGQPVSLGYCLHGEGWGAVLGGSIVNQRCLATLQSVWRALDFTPRHHGRLAGGDLRRGVVDLHQLVPVNGRSASALDHIFAIDTNL